METSKRKKNILFITILSVVGLIGALALQIIWIYNSYELIKNDIQDEGYATIEKALENGEIVPYFQPKYSLHTENLIYS